MTQAVLEEAARNWFSLGLGVGFIVAVGYLILLLQEPEIDLGWLGLMFLLIIIFFLIAFSFLVAAATPGIEIKIAVSVVDALVLLGSKLLAPSFLDYLADEGDGVPLSKRTADHQPKLKE
jgi:hypothetical protein